VSVSSYGINLRDLAGVNGDSIDDEQRADELNRRPVAVLE
jgi:hypothetical protein